MTEHEMVLTSTEQLRQLLQETGDGCMVNVVMELSAAEQNVWKEDRSCTNSSK